MENTGKLIACDIYAHKLDIIKEGAARLGLTNLETRLADARVLQQELADKADFVLCDVPCSGFGIIRKKPEIRFKDPEAVAELPALQLEILRSCARYARPGGTLVYSTCTVLRRENEDVVRAFLAENGDFEPAPFTHPACGERADGMATLLPSVNGTDGFFIAKLRRKA